MSTRIQRLTASFAAVATLVTASACGINPRTGNLNIGGLDINKQMQGVAVGGALGGLLGSQIGGGRGKLAATAGGAVLGALVGGAIGGALDQRDHELAGGAFRTSMTQPLGRSYNWRNPHTGHYGVVRPLRQFQQRGTDCREYETTVYVDGQPETGRGTACRLPDGTWALQP